MALAGPHPCQGRHRREIEMEDLGGRPTLPQVQGGRPEVKDDPESRVDQEVPELLEHCEQKPPFTETADPEDPGSELPGDHPDSPRTPACTR